MIVAGVLLALAGDAAWAERSDRIREQEVLVDLLEEFKENETILLADIETNRKARQAGAEWADAMLGHVSLSADSASALLLTALRSARFDPVTGALRSLVDGGELRIIRDSNLRRALAGWADRTAEARLTTESMHGQRHSLLPFVMALPVDRPFSPGQRSAVFAFAQSVAGQSEQLEALVEPIRAIVTMIEGEINP